MFRKVNQSASQQRKLANTRAVIRRAVEPLEQRVLLSVVMVTTTADSGTGSLRQAIATTNGSGATVDTIAFDIGSGGAQTITPATPLPIITNPVIIDATTQPGFQGPPLIEISGGSAGGSANGLTINAGNTTVKGFVINGFGNDGILIQHTGGDVIQDNYIGLDATGATDAPNFGDGILISGVPNNQIGGVGANEGNVISGNGTKVSFPTNARDGIHVQGAGATGNLIRNNLLGTDATGEIAIGNSKFGVELDGAVDNHVGGKNPAARNVVAANTAGIEIDNTGQRNVVRGNLVGTDIQGTSPLGNTLHGVVFGVGMNNNGNVVGGVGAGQGNTIAFNGTAGVAVFGSTSTADNNSILGNAIFSNGRSNPSVLLGIDLVPSQPFPTDDGVTPNTPGGPHVGPNDLQNFPVLTTAAGVAGGTTITGTLNSTPSTTFTIAFYSNPSTIDVTNAEGETFLGTTTVTTDASGNASISTTVAGKVLPGQLITATATAPLGDTSEFSAAVAASGLSTVSFVINTNDSGTGSLRQAILAANADSTQEHIIAFNIPGNGPQTITPLSPLPAITNPVIIDATTQPGYQGAPIIELSGELAGTGANGLTIKGGDSTVKGFVIDRFSNDGIMIRDKGGNTIQNNYIGTNSNGSGRLPNGGDGVMVASVGSNLIGGLEANQGNVISANGSKTNFPANAHDGIHLKGSAATANVIEGNYLGTDATGTTALGNSKFGVEIDGAKGNTVGGTSVAARNVISANTANVEIDNTAQSNHVEGNYIGSDKTGTVGLGTTLHGVVFGTGQNNNNNVIGGTAAGDGNLIAFNGTAGVAVFGSTSTAKNDAIEGNSIFNNGVSNTAFLLGIDLVPTLPFPTDDGVTANTPGGPHVGPNDLQNFPVLNDATAVGGGTTITGTLNSTPNTTFRIEFFSNSASLPNAHAEGQNFLGFTTVTTDGSGNATISATVSGKVTTGELVTATAIDPSGNTSEFSAAVTV